MIEPRFLTASDFHEGVARAVLEGPCMADPGQCLPKYAIGVSKDWYEASAANIERQLASPFPACRYAIIGRDGRVRSDRRFTEIWDFRDGAAVASDGHWQGHVDMNGNERPAPAPARPPDSKFRMGLELVHRSDGIRYIDAHGKTVFIYPLPPHRGIFDLPEKKFLQQ